MTRTIRFSVVFAIAAAALIISGCPSPFNSVLEKPAQDQPEQDQPEQDQPEPYQTSAEVSFDFSRGVVVFTEEDGTETPVVVIKDGIEDGPVEIIDYTVLDDGGSSTGRFSSSNNRPRCIVVGRRRDGRTGVWIIYRHGGVELLLNENGDPVLDAMVEVEGSPFLGDGWSYIAKEIEFDSNTNDGIIIGTLSRPGGWEYPELHGDDAPAPSIGIFWSIHKVNGILMISRARPILLMNKPEPNRSLSMRSGGRRRSEWLDMLREWLQNLLLKRAWKFLAAAESFVSNADVIKAADAGEIDAVYRNGIPAGTFVVAGPDKDGTKAWAWLTYKSVENIVDAPEDAGGGNLPPWPVTGPTKWQLLSQDDTFPLQVSDFSDPRIVYVSPGPFDPDGNTTDPDGNTTVKFEAIFVSMVPEHPTNPNFIPKATAEYGIFSMVWDSIYDGSGYQITFMVKTSDGMDETLSESDIRVIVN